jgi:hypothetical protein
VCSLPVAGATNRLAVRFLVPVTSSAVTVSATAMRSGPCRSAGRAGPGVDQVVETPEITPRHARIVVGVDLEQQGEALPRVALDGVGVSEETVAGLLGDRVQLRRVGLAAPRPSATRVARWERELLVGGDADCRVALVIGQGGGELAPAQRCSGRAVEHRGVVDLPASRAVEERQQARPRQQSGALQRVPPGRG